MARCVLIVEDEFLISETLSIMIEDLGLEVCGKAANADEAVQLATAHMPSLVLMDVRLKGSRDGVDAAGDIRRISPVPVIFITGSREPETVARINAGDPAGVLFKPFRFEQLKLIVDRLMV